MSHTVPGKLFKAPFIKTGCGKDGQSTMFAFKLSEKTKDFKTGADIYANYDVVIYAQSQAQVEYYTGATAEGSFVVVTCEKLQPKISDCGKYVNLNMDNPRLEAANFTQQGGQAQQAPQVPSQQPAPQMAPAYQPAPQAAPQQAPLTANEQSWVDSVKANPAVLNQLEEGPLKEKVKMLTGN